MTLFLGIIIFILLATIMAGLIRVVQGPRPADRMLAAQLFGTAAVAIVLILSRLMGDPAFLDVALVFGLLAAVALVSFVVLASRRLS